MDIFPTILDALTFDGSTKGILQGQSLFLKERWPYVVQTRYNAGRIPFEFSLHKGDIKLIARFKEQKDIFRSQTLEILSLRTCREQNCWNQTIALHRQIHSEFDAGLNQLFSAPKSQTIHSPIERVRH
jgi:hypothetical protein